MGWKMFKKHLEIIGSCCIILLLLTTIKCAKRESNSIKIGVIMPLTGDAAQYGIPSLNAISLAILQANSEREQEQPEIKLIPEDDKAQASLAISAFQKLVKIDNVKLILGPLVSSATLSVAPLADSNKVVLFTPSSSAPALTNAGDYVFRNELSDLFGGTAQAELAISKLGFKKIACVYINNDYGSGLFKVFKDKFQMLGGQIIFEDSFAQSTTDFRSIITRLKLFSPDAVFLISHDEIINFVRQMVELGAKFQIYTTPVFEDNRNIEKLGSLADGIIYTYYGNFDPSSSDEQVKIFITQYKELYKESPTYYAALAYDAASILLEALRRTSYRIDDVKNELYKIQHFPGITGETTFDKNGDVSKPVSLKTVKKGKFIFIP